VSTTSSDWDLSRFLPELRRDGEPQLLRAHAMPQSDLFADVTNMTPKAMLSAAPQLLDDRFVAIAVADDLIVTLKHDRAQPSMIQSFVAGLCESWRTSERRSGTLEPVVIDPEIGLAVWAPQAAGLADAAARLWTQISRDGRPDPLDSLTTPSIYGNKSRIARTLYAIAAATLPEGSPVLDLMSGTGIVTRMLARRHSMTANDANPYAALLTRVQSIAFGDGGERVASTLIENLRDRWMAHASALQSRYRMALEAEERFLHGEFDAGSLERYVAFISDAIPAAAIDEANAAGDLVTTRYANAYFGVGQAIEIDAIRVAIDALTGVDDAQRDLCLAALVLTACTCNPGPHFAQPRKVNSRRMLRDVVDRRARSVSWEFEVALRRLASREPLPRPMGPTTQTDWRIALDRFTVATSSARVRTVYLDPPYTKLQYSRYYHVLNVLLANDYPPISGTGRYPPRSYRFSSRFEYQPAMARREFEDVIGRCAENGVGMMISYGERGFVSIDALTEMLTQRFRKLDVFSEPLRHHSQGRSLSQKSGGRVNEYVLVARP
jgi:hypothetical protein